MVLVASGLGAVAKFFISAIFVIIPGVLIKKIAFYAFVQPCFQEILNDPTQEKTTKFFFVSRCSQCINFCGYCYVINWGILFLALGVLMWTIVAQERASGNLPERGRLLISSCVDYQVELHDSCVRFV